MASSSSDEKPSFCQRFSTGLADFRKFLYNGETGEVMGRSGRSWAKIGVFYLIFYGFLAGFFSAMLAVFMTTIEFPEDGGKPKLTQYIENKPGLTRLDHNSRLQGYDSNKNTSDYANMLIGIFKGIKDNKLYKGECPTDTRENVTKPCYAPFSIYGDCQPDPVDIDNSMFGLKEKKPCIFIKINKVFGWVPKGDKFLKLACTGTGLSKTFPEGFLLNGFPFEGGASIHLPFVAVQVDNTDPNTKVEIKCKLEGEDIEVSSSFNKARSYGNVLIEKISAK